MTPASAQPCQGTCDVDHWTLLTDERKLVPPDPNRAPAAHKNRHQRNSAALAKVPGMAGGGTLRTTARMLPEAAARGAGPEPREYRPRPSKRNFAGREALAYPQTVSVTEDEHLPRGADIRCIPAPSAVRRSSLPAREAAW
jgi:hypothetical protein